MLITTSVVFAYVKNYVQALIKLVITCPQILMLNKQIL